MHEKIKSRQTILLLIVAYIAISALTVVDVLILFLFQTHSLLIFYSIQVTLITYHSSPISFRNES